ncbi:MAG: hypothetical protein QOG37_1753 [Mycobacterium sp.]|jgi:hypothetical protein|nr:hypothetical protein [Mycobacterium sp.]
MISPMRTAINTPHPTNARGFRQPGVGWGGGSWPCPPPLGPWP